MMYKLRYTAGLCLLLFMTTLWAEVAIPNLSQRVTDLTGTLTAEQIAALETKLADFEAKKGSQIAVLLLPTTQPEDIAAFGIRVAEVWKIGREKVDDGVIMIIAKDDRRSRLEVGRGLEGVIPDAIAKRVLAETMRPHFKNEDYAGGIDAGVTQLIGLIEGETLPAPTGDTSSDGFDGFMILLFFCCVIVDLIFSALLGSGMGFVLAGLSIGGISAVAASFFALDIWLAVIIGLAMFLCLKLFYLGGGSSGGTGSSWGSGSSSGSSDWGGGGGDFGGGGASDSW